MSVWVLCPQTYPTTPPGTDSRIGLFPALTLSYKKGCHDLPESIRILPLAGFIMTSDQSIYNSDHAYKARPIKAIIIGAGVSGIAFTHLIKDYENVEFTLYDKNPEVCGTWYEARYPGCSCDIPSHSYTYSFRGNPDWSGLYVGREEIFHFFRGLAEEYGVYEHTKFEKLVVGAEWLKDSDQWKVTIKDLKTEEISYDYCNVLLNASGALNKWSFPDIKGLKSFDGPVIHSAAWDDSVDFTDKRVAVIGSGASAIQIVPSVHPKVKSLVSFNRSANWISGEFASELATNGRETKYSEEERKRFREDPEYFLNWRKRVEHAVNMSYDVFVKDSEVHKEMTAQCIELMKKRLNYDEDLIKKLIPDFSLGCRRLTPGNNYLETLAKDNVTVETAGIDEVTKNAIVTKEGTKHEVDIIVCATGYDTTYVPRFPIVGIDGVDLRDRWTNGPSEAYLGVTIPNYPNYFMTAGPNSPISNGSLIPSLEKQIEYCIKWLHKIQTEDIRYVMPTQEATDEFNEMKDAMMEHLSFTSHCTSWYKISSHGGKVAGPWPGSGPHYMEVMKNLRAEDYAIKYRTKNRFHFLGDGHSSREGKGMHLGWYVRDELMDKKAEESV